MVSRIGFRPNPNLLNNLLHSTDGFDCDAHLTGDTFLAPRTTRADL